MSFAHRHTPLVRADALRWAWLLVLCLACLCAMPRPAIAQAPVASAAVTPTPPVLLVQEGVAHLNADPHSQQFLDTGSQLSFEQLLAKDAGGQIGFEPRPAKAQVYNLKGEDALWIKLVLSYAADVKSNHYLVLPFSYVDDVQFFVQREGRWVQHVAGDRIDMSRWTEHTRYPALALDRVPEGEVPVYVRIVQGTKSTFPLWLQTSRHFHEQDRNDWLLHGAVAGALMLLVLVCLIQGLVFKDFDHVAFAGFGALLALAVAMFSGILPQLLPYQTGLWADPGRMVMFCLSASALVFLQRLVLKGTSAPAWSMTAMRVVAWLGLPCALLGLLMPRSWAASLLGPYILSTVASAFLAAWIAWRAQSRSSLWLMLALLPVALGALVLGARLAGVAVPVWIINHAMMLAYTLNLPLMLVALNQRSRDIHVAQTRAMALESRDALTGLLAPHLFHDRLERCCKRFETHETPAAVLMLRIANFASLKESFGQQVADKALLQASIRLRRLLPDAENLARLGESRFGLIVDARHERAAIQALCARVVAAGLTPMNGMPEGLVLNFHCAVLLLAERYMPASEAVEALNAQLEHMSPTTRTPIRVLEPATRNPAGSTGPSSTRPPLKSADGGIQTMRPALDLPSGGWSRAAWSQAGSLQDSKQ